MTDNSGDRTPRTFLLKSGSYLISSRLATYCGNMVAHKTFCTRATVSAMVATVVPGTPVFIKLWSRLAFGSRSQRMKSANKES